MNELRYTPTLKPGTDYNKEFLQIDHYKVNSLYEHEMLKRDFLRLKETIVDLSPAMITKAINGTEQSYIALMNKAKAFIRDNHLGEATHTEELLLKMFSDCVFGYYILTPLIEDDAVSDIKIYSWDKITVKAKGERYVTDLKFASEADYNSWYERIIRINHAPISEILQHVTDIKGSGKYYMRIDIENEKLVSTEANNLHIRKIPKEKYTWDYLIKAGMLDENMKAYILDRAASGYSFLISGKGGSGKTSLLNQVLDVLPHNNSILVVQESDELYSNVHPQLQLEHTFEQVKEINGLKQKIEYTLEDELRMGLLQDIDTFVVGEIKGGEALNVLTTAMGTGANSLGTIHAESCRGSVRRLCQLAKFVSDYSIEALEEMMASVPVVLIHMSHFAIDEITEITGWNRKDRQIIYADVWKRSEDDLQALIARRKAVT